MSDYRPAGCERCSHVGGINKIITHRLGKMSRFDFRVKLDLYKYYQDARRFCWVFVDGTKMLDVSHLKRHITRLLSIEEPFYLLLNDHEYLPPNEDIRILKENERILVVPGTGLENQSESMEVSPSKDNSLLENRQRINIPVTGKEIHTINYPLNQEEPKEILHEKKDQESSKQDDASSFSFNGYQPDLTGSSSFHTLMEETEVESSMYKTIPESDTIEDSSAMDILVPIPKKKRIRKRKQKTKAQSEEEPKKTYSNLPNKPKIISACTIPTGKHIRFVNPDNEATFTDASILLTPTVNGLCRSNSEQDKLSALLSLGKNSTPLTFTSSNPKTTGTEEMSESDILSASTNVTPEKIQKELFKDNVKVDNKAGGTPEDIIESFTESSAGNYSKAPAQLYAKDIIAFKTLKMGADYSPQVSNYIIAEVLSAIVGELSKYNVKILRGLEEIETPVGKFTVEEENEESTKNDTIMVNCNDFIESRLLHTTESTVKTKPSP